MRLLHTSDWHLGHSLHGYTREYEHDCFLAWLLKTIGEQRIDNLVICGDIFDSANPPAKAQAQYYNFLATAKQQFPQLQIVIIGGNHDSVSRLEAPSPLLDSFGISVIGGLGTLGIDPDRILIALNDHNGNPCACCVAIPFLRPADLPRIDETEKDPFKDPLIEGVHRVYQSAFAAARKRYPGLPLIVTGHCYMSHGELSELSERKILCGNQHALPAEIFDHNLAYVALGHLHKPQLVGGKEHIRYSGAPLPLSISEERYHNQVVVLELVEDDQISITPLEVPRSVKIFRVPSQGSLNVTDLLVQLQQLPGESSEGTPLAEQPFLEVSVLMEKPEPNLRQQIEEALEGKGVRLVKVTPSYSGSQNPLAESTPAIQLKHLQPEDVFARKYQSSFEDEPSPELLSAFYELLDQAANEEMA